VDDRSSPLDSLKLWIVALLGHSRSCSREANSLVSWEPLPVSAFSIPCITLSLVLVLLLLLVLSLSMLLLVPL
jgi:hypothetical protein